MLQKKMSLGLDVVAFHVWQSHGYICYVTRHSRATVGQLESRMPETLKAMSKPLSEESEKTLTTLAAEVSLHFAK
jgi:hypothetical protein